MLEIKLKGKTISNFEKFKWSPGPGQDLRIGDWDSIERYAFLVYEYWRLRGDYNMNDIESVCKASNLDGLMYIYIINNYNRLREKYNIEQRQLETQMLQELIKKI